MSGLAAQIRFDGGDASAAVVAAMTGAMAYRGPDGIAHHVQGAVGFGYCAMHAMAESHTASQPLLSADGTTMVVFDGYLANYDELRSDLLARGARLRSRADAELVLHAYAVWGANFARHCDGEFAAVLWDSRTREALLVRDHHGLRPLYWHFDGQVLLVASEIAAVLAALPEAPQPNFGYLAEIADGARYSDEETVWQGILRAPPAHALRVREGTATKERYWAVPSEVDIHYPRDEDYFEHYLALFKECVRRSARSDRPLACEVSGGLDSSSVYCLAHLLQREGHVPAPELRGYTLAGPEGTDADEIEFARAVGAHTGTAIGEYQLFRPPIEWFAARAADDCDLPPLPNAAMSITMDEAAARDGCRVNLNGIGGDQWLDGNHHYYGELFDRRAWGPLLACYRADVAGLGLAEASGLLARFGLGSLIAPRWRRALREVLRGGAADESCGPLLPHWRDEVAARKMRYEAGFPEDYRASYKLRKMAGWSRILDQANRQRARSGLEMRSPMMLRAFIEFSARTPEHMRLRGGVTKYIHRRALAGILPPLVEGRETKAEFSAAYTHLEPALLSAGEGDEVNSDSPLDPRGVAAVHQLYRDTAIDERGHGGIWGIYVTILTITLNCAMRKRNETMTEHSANLTAKTAYQRPELKVYGSVRNLTGGSSGSMNDGTGIFTIMMGMMSDPRAKENIVEVGRHPAGFGLYLFDYKAEFVAIGGAGRKFGVMADEVARIASEAVMVDADGYQRVDYAQLGIVLH